MKFSLLAFIVLMSSNAFAWGPTGHRAVGEVADKYLTKRARKFVSKILDGHSLARVSNWPDKIKSDPDNYGHTYNWHYMSWQIGSQTPDPDGGKLLAAIDANIETLKNRKAPKKDRAFALKFLVHLIGDLHQPLHVGNGLDRGGNSCKVIFHGSELNLHKLWDERMIEFSQLSFTELARFVNVIDKNKVKEYKKGNVTSWARESADLRVSVYPLDPQPELALGGVRSYCRRDITLTTEQLPKLSYKYSYTFMPVLEKRILQAGIRLAQIINKIKK